MPAAQREEDPSQTVKGRTAWQQVVDNRLVAIITTLMTRHDPRKKGPWAPELLLDLGSAVIDDLKLPGGQGRYRATKQRLVCMAGVYGTHFPPAPGWTLHPRAEHDLLVWTSRKRLLIELPRAVGRNDPLLPPTLDQTLRGPVAALAAEHGASATTVRVLPLGAPANAVWVEPQTGATAAIVSPQQPPWPVGTPVSA